MGKYIVEKTHISYAPIAYVSIFLLIFNVFHSTLMSIFSLYSVTSTIFIQGFSLIAFLLYVNCEKKVNLLQIRLQVTDMLLILTLIVMLVTVKDVAYNFTYILRYSVLVLLVMIMKYDDSLADVFFKCIMISGFIHVFMTLWFYFDVDFYMTYVFPTFGTEQQEHIYPQVMYNHNAVGLTGYYSLNGIYMGIALSCAYALLFDNKKKNAFLYVCVFSATFLALFLTGKRGVLIFAVFAMILTYLICNKNSAIRKFVVLLFIIIAAILILYVLSFYIEGITSTFYRFYQTLFESNTYDVSSGRFKLYDIALDFFKESPIFGIGWREFTNRVRIFFRGDDQLMDTHNVFLQLLCETGIVGFVIFVSMFAAFFIMTMYYAAKSAKDSKYISDNLKVPIVFSLFYQIFFLGYCFTGNPLYDLETLYIYIISCGITSTVHFKVCGKNKKSIRHDSKYIIQ